MEAESSKEKAPSGGLTPEKREDLWALIIALLVLLACLAAPTEIHHFFKKIIYIF